MREIEGHPNFHHNQHSGRAIDASPHILIPRLTFNLSKVRSIYEIEGKKDEIKERKKGKKTRESPPCKSENIFLFCGIRTQEVLQLLRFHAQKVENDVRELNQRLHFRCAGFIISKICDVDDVTIESREGQCSNDRENSYDEDQPRLFIYVGTLGSLVCDVRQCSQSMGG